MGDLRTRAKQRPTLTQRWECKMSNGRLQGTQMGRMELFWGKIWADRK